MQEKKQNISPIKQRILQFVDTLGISKREFYTQIGVSRGTLESKTGITEEIITKFITTYPNISIEWLMTGYGEIYKTTKDFATTKKEEKNHPIARLTNNPKEGIPLIPIEAMAGALTCDNTILEYECDRYVVPVFKGADFLIPVKGSSMYPKYSSGDIVACQRISMNNLFFQWNKVYVLDTNQGALIKRIKPGHDESHILIVSDNEKYDPFELPISAIHAVALVIGVIRLE
jgi:phage repressor protein C with HTH and peptisase S24 domain